MDVYYLIIHLLMGPLLFSISILLLLRPPEKMNALWGYRTPASLKNKDTWESGNRFSAKLMMWFSLVCILLQFVSALLFDWQTSIYIGIVGLIICVIRVIVFTETYLARRFDEDGKRIKA